MEQTLVERIRQKVLAVELDRDELACRMLEAQMDQGRPAEMSATEALDCQTPELADLMRRGAEAAIRYLAERINAGAAVQ